MDVHGMLTFVVGSLGQGRPTSPAVGLAQLAGSSTDQLLALSMTQRPKFSFTSQIGPRAPHYHHRRGSGYEAL